MEEQPYKLTDLRRDSQRPIYAPFKFKLSELLPDDSSKRPALTPAQQQRFLRFLEECCDDLYYYDIIILLETGLRVSELYGLTVSDVDLHYRRIYIRRQLCRTAEKPYFVCPPKSQSGIRTIPLSEKACRAFRHVLENRPTPKVEMMIDGCSGFLFLDSFERPKVAMHLENYMRYIRQTHKAQYGTLPNITPHVLRHTFCTNLHQAGLDVKSLQYVMGHNDPEITMALYAHTDYDFVEKAFRKAVS